MSAPEDRPGGEDRNVQIEARLLTGEMTFEVVTQDLIKSGICALSGHPVKPGALVKLSLSLVLGKNSFSEPLELSAKVAWCTPLDRPDLVTGSPFADPSGQQVKVYQLGLLFAGMDHQRLGYLDMFMRLLQGELVLDIPEMAASSTGALDDTKPD
jgi:hypothetical protein